MTTIKDITKLYPTLRPEERLSLMFAARARKDVTEYDELIRTAPKGKTFQMRDFYGITDAFDWLVMWHLMFQLGQLGTFNYLLHFEDELNEVRVKINHHESEGIKEQQTDFDTAIRLTAQRILESRDAWRAICGEYNIDPHDALKDYPFIEYLELMELTVDAAAREMDITPKDTQAAIEAYRDVIKTKRAEWE